MQDFFSASFFPHDVKSTDRPLVHGYISSSRVTDLISLFKTAIIQPLLPGLRKEGYQERYASFTATVSLTHPSTFSTTTSTSAPASTSNPAPRQPLRNPSPPPSLDRPFSHPYASGIPSSNPLQIGRSDLDPLGGRSNPFAPPPLFSPPGSGDGMFVGPNHPMFSGRGGRGGMGGMGGIGGLGPMGPWGGDGYLPPMGAPPGARSVSLGHLRLSETSTNPRSS